MLGHNATYSPVLKEGFGAYGSHFRFFSSAHALWAKSELYMLVSSLTYSHTYSFTLFGRKFEILGREMLIHNRHLYNLSRCVSHMSGHCLDLSGKCLDMSETRLHLSGTCLGLSITFMMCLDHVWNIPRHVLTMSKLL